MLYQAAAFQLAHADERKEPLAELFSTVARQLQEWWKRTRSFTCYDLFYRLYTQWLELKGNYEQILSLTSQSEMLLEELGVNTRRFDRRYNHGVWVRACLRTGAVNEGLQLAGVGGPLFEPTSHQWFAHQESYLLLALHGQAYTLAEEVARQAEQIPFPDQTSPWLRERWRLYRGYLDWMHPNGKALPLLEEGLAQQMIPSGGRDRSGYHVAVVILQFCYHLQANGETGCWPSQKSTRNTWTVT